MCPNPNFIALNRVCNELQLHRLTLYLLNFTVQSEKPSLYISFIISLTWMAELRCIEAGQCGDILEHHLQNRLSSFAVESSRKNRLKEGTRSPEITSHYDDAQYGAWVISSFKPVNPDHKGSYAFESECLRQWPNHYRFLQHPWLATQNRGGFNTQQKFGNSLEAVYNIKVTLLQLPKCVHQHSYFPGTLINGDMLWFTIWSNGPRK